MGTYSAIFSVTTCLEAGWHAGIDRSVRVAIMCFLWIFFGGLWDFGNLLWLPRPRFEARTCREYALAINPRVLPKAQFFLSRCLFFTQVMVRLFDFGVSGVYWRDFFDVVSDSLV